jgi:large subunit ribosomal protein L9
MKVILKQDLPNVGEEGDICDVARGFARNYLIPRSYAVMYNAQNVSELEGRRKAIEKRKEEKREAARSIKERIDALELVIEVTAGEKGKLFGSVTGNTIAEELEKNGISVEKKRIEIPDGTIKSLGKHTVQVRLYGNQEASLTVIVKSDKEEKADAAATDPAKGKPVTGEAGEPDSDVGAASGGSTEPVIEEAAADAQQTGSDAGTAEPAGSENVEDASEEARNEHVDDEDDKS